MLQNAIARKGPMGKVFKEKAVDSDGEEVFWNGGEEEKQLSV